MSELLYEDDLPGNSHWSLQLAAGTALRLTDIEGGANVGMLFYNPHNLLERYNAPDTLKCQHTFKLTAGHCLYSDMGHIFCSIVEDTTGWIDTVAGTTNKAMVNQRWGERDYQHDRNNWKQNGYDSFLVEIAKYGLGDRDLAANLNLFSKVATDEDGALVYAPEHSKAGDSITLRFEMDTVVVMNSCPHPLNPAEQYPHKGVHFEVLRADPVQDDDLCLNSRPENGRGFENTRRYCLGLGIAK
ncbi:urea amidolyase associated protein UAAP1 [Celerinatantimonas sp. YJH-8]|uniref:urea amidolyase associated protein UAAP1 n=1 Tax=Celerinatantimonas sp. YJH-8 TaxID=3228714 RepID=UPI0038C76506